MNDNLKTAEYQQRVIRDLGGCGDLSPDGQHICILEPGHTQLHRWNVPQVGGDLQGRIQIFVEVDMDPVPGWGHDPNYYVKHIEQKLNQTFPHYNPVVMLLPTDDRVLPARETEKSGP